jgi:hypothetical protein
MVRRMRLFGIAGIVVVVLIGVACSGDSTPAGATQAGEKAAPTQPPERSSYDSGKFAESGLSIAVPHGWSVSGFSETVFPRRLVAATYSVERDDVEGDCGGVAAVQRLPSDGAYVVLIDYGNVDAATRQQDFKQRLPLALDNGQLAEFECFGRSYAFHVVVEGRGIQAHLALGRRADQTTRADALTVLNSISVSREP